MTINTMTNGKRIEVIVTELEMNSVSPVVLNSLKEIKDNCPEFWNGTMMNYEFYDWIQFVLTKELSYSSLCSEKKSRGEDVSKEHAQEYWLIASSAKEAASKIVVFGNEIVINKHQSLAA